MVSTTWAWQLTAKHCYNLRRRHQNDELFWRLGSISLVAVLPLMLEAYSGDEVKSTCHCSGACAGKLCLLVACPLSV